MVLIGQKTLGEKLGIDVMAHLKAFVLKPGHQDSARMETTARAVNETNAGAVLRAAMAVTAFGPSDDAPGDADDDVMLTMLPQRPTMFQDSVVEMLDRVEALETAADYAVDHSLTLGCAKMLHDIVYRTHPSGVVGSQKLLGGPAVAVGDAAGRSRVHAPECQVHKGAVRWKRQVFRRRTLCAPCRAAAGGRLTLDTALGVASLDSEGLYRVEYHDHRVI